MVYHFEQMTQEQAEIIAGWRYDGIYSFFDMKADEEDLTEFLDAEKRGNHYFSVKSDGELCGFFSFNKNDDGTEELALGMRPDLTGRGFGLEFINEGIDFAKEKLSVETLTLSVATFNKRAIKVYERAGFTPGKTFMQATNGSEFEFLGMQRKLKNNISL